MASNIDQIGSLIGGASGASSFVQARQDAMNAAAGALGMSPSDLRTAMSQGETLAQIATSKGISASSLQNTIESSLKADLPNASSTQLDNLSSRMMNHVHGGGGHHGSESTTAANSASTSQGANDATGDGNQVGSLVNVVV